MGMAASQARYLALVARKSNCEYEGQQINQARTALSNQSANLFNQMLGLTVPVPPSTQDFTKTQYSYTDGVNESVISNWRQLSTSDPEFNYVVTHHYYYDRYTGSQKQLSDPQVQFTGTGTATVKEIQAALENITNTKKEYEEAKAAREAAQKEAATLRNYQDEMPNYVGTVKNCTIDENGYYKIEGDTETTFKPYDKCKDSSKQTIDEAIANLKKEGALAEDFDINDVYFDGKSIAFKSDLNKLNGLNGGTATSLPVYGTENITSKISTYDSNIANLRNTETKKLDAYNQATKYYNETLYHPTYVGNSELTPLEVLNQKDTPDQWAEIQQIIEDMREQGIETGFENCFDGNGNYTGGIYSFKLNGVTYYTTYYDLENSYAKGTGNNHIDGQPKLAYYNASYVSTKVEETGKALLETDGNGRFTSVRFEDDSVTYTLNMEQTTDEAAYKDAMNQYYYENAQYDKAVQDINAKTSIIQQEDQQLELRLKQLDTEQNALSTEIDAVSKVVKDNVESSFKTFGG